ncbi:hypothetical protein BKA00_006507 [Actinomadura coerulea]|uniref:Uncharacterized protein n=1 Tax=Actinomadura coerulea TaxID=46159 RepID=A0A7X0G548_9ACTN|nr:hypothetical protein [Actinomadura coerulea]
MNRVPDFPGRRAGERAATGYVDHPTMDLAARR